MGPDLINPHFQGPKGEAPLADRSPAPYRGQDSLGDRGFPRFACRGTDIKRGEARVMASPTADVIRPSQPFRA